jgi:2-dehydro-3-deoxygluconokinase
MTAATTTKTQPRRIVCFGEMLLRLTPPGRERLLQSPRFETSFGGAETNVAVGLARLGDDARMITVLPEGAIGQAALAELGRWGVDTAGVRLAPGRMGLYFLTPGAVLRPAEALYDRTGSAFAHAAPDLIDWTAELAGAAWLHVSGITPAVSPNAAAAALTAVKTARALGVSVSFDGNFRARVWADRIAEAPAILRGVLAHADLAFIAHRDIGLILGEVFDDPKAAANAAFEAFPHLARIAATSRTILGPEEHDLSARLFTRAGDHQTETVRLKGIVDRVGAGDAFSAGVLHSLAAGLGDAEALDYGLACCALKHGIVGDFPLITPEDVAGFSATQGDLRR